MIKRGFFDGASVNMVGVLEGEVAKAQELVKGVVEVAADAVHARRRLRLKVEYLI